MECRIFWTTDNGTNSWNAKNEVGMAWKSVIQKIDRENRRRIMNETRRNPGSSIARNAVFNAIYKSLDILFPMISAGYAARILTPSGIGRNAIAQNNVSYFLVVA